MKKFLGTILDRCNHSTQTFLELIEGQSLICTVHFIRSVGKPIVFTVPASLPQAVALKSELPDTENLNYAPEVGFFLTGTEVEVYKRDVSN